jgi:hypothetical protein
LDYDRGNDPLGDGHRRRVDAGGGRYLGLTPDLTSVHGEPPVELDWRAFCARYVPGGRWSGTGGDLGAVWADVDG